MSSHRVQGQMVFLAAGYVVTALEAYRSLAEAVQWGGKDARVIELEDFVIHQAFVFDQDADTRSIEVLIAISEITREQARIRGRFTYLAATGDAEAKELGLAASCLIDIFLGEPLPSLLQRREPAQPRMIDVEPEQFYGALADLGIQLWRRFRSLRKLTRRHARSSALVKAQPSDPTW